MTPGNDNDNNNDNDFLGGEIPMTQDAIEWEESQEVDLRTLAARSSLFALSSPPSTRTRVDSISSLQGQPFSSKKDERTKKKGYSPGREVEGIFTLLHNESIGSTTSDPLPIAETQPHSNLVRANTYPPPSTSLGRNMKHRRKRRVDNHENQEHDPLPQLKCERQIRPRNLDSSQKDVRDGSSTTDPSLGFDDLLKQLDQTQYRRYQSLPHLKSGSYSQHPPDDCARRHFAPESEFIGTPVNHEQRLSQTKTKTENEYSDIRKTISSSITSMDIHISQPSTISPRFASFPPIQPLTQQHSSSGQQTFNQKHPTYYETALLVSTKNVQGPMPRNQSSIPTSQSSAPTTAQSVPIQPTKVQSYQKNSPTLIKTDQLLHLQPVMEKKHPSSIPSSSSQTIQHEEVLEPTSITTSISQFVDDFEYSAEDLAALDAVLFVAVQARQTQSSTVMNNGSSIAPKNEEADSIVMKSQSTTDDRLNDPFGDDLFTHINFDDLDKQIQQRESIETILTQPPHANLLTPQSNKTRILVPPPLNALVRNKVSTGFDPKSCFLSFSRYQIIVVIDDITSYTKTVVVKAWNSEMLSDLCDKNPQTFLSSFAAPRKELSLDESDGSIFLRGEWYHTHLETGDVVHLCSLSGKYETKSASLPVILHTAAPIGSDPNDDLVLVVHPDCLVAPTIISETVSCSRRAVLKSRLGSTGLTSKAALFGTMRHELFERSMRSQDFSVKTARETASAIARQSAESLVALGITDAEANNEVIRVLPQLQHFAVTYTEFGMSRTDPMAVPGKGALLEGSSVNPELHFLANEVHATEESMLSHELGLKGNVDCTIVATTREVKNVGRSQVEPRTNLISIELKTGHNTATQNAHMAQLALYTLMLRTRYGNFASDSGVLLYLNNEDCRAVRVKPLLNELKSLIGQRNLVAVEMKRSSRPRGIVLNVEEDTTTSGAGAYLLPTPCTELPQVLTSAYSCNKCYSNRECMMYAASDAVNPTRTVPLSGMQKSHGHLLKHFSGHLELGDFQYFRDWDRLIDIEAAATNRVITTSWLTPSCEGELLSGATVTSLVLDLNDRGEQSKEAKPTKLVIARRSKDSPLNTLFTSLHVECGNHVVLSTDNTSLCEVNLNDHPSRRRQMQIARGFVDLVEEHRIVIRFSVQEYDQIALHVRKIKDFSSIDEIKFRLDKDDISTGIGTLRQNLINFFTTDITPFGKAESDPRLTQGILVRNRYSWLRDVVVRLRVPSFGTIDPSALFTRPLVSVASVPGCSLERLQLEFQSLNVDQQNAIASVFNAKDYSLIQGMPGTGKTSVTAFIARLMVAHGKRVLITSYTHAAVDNLMIMLMEKGIATTSISYPMSRLARIGSKSACHPSVHSVLVPQIAATRECWDDEMIHQPKADSLRNVISSARIVGVSALTIPRSPLMVGQNFDVVIVDEAGQISQPAILGALMAADSFVLVGDHMQLPPLVNSEIAEQGGLGVSMLRRLADKYPSAVSQLTLQYRMHEQICNLCNEIVYNGMLQCATYEVQKQRLCLTGFPSALPLADRWLTNVVNPSRPIVFINTDPNTTTITGLQCSPIVGLERSLGKKGRGGTVNDTEAKIIGRILIGLFACGVPASCIGVISPFRAQLRLLEEIPGLAKWRESGLEASTIDRFQGRDKDVIVLSFVRSNPKGKAGRLLEDFRRLNVAVSRAKSKLIMVGSFSTLHRGSEVLRPVLEGLRKRHQVQHLPENFAFK